MRLMLNRIVMPLPKGSSRADGREAHTYGCSMWIQRLAAKATCHQDRTAAHEVQLSSCCLHNHNPAKGAVITAVRIQSHLDRQM